MAIRSRQRSQAIVEFGLIALLFTALMFATVDFGLMLNTWQAVSSGTRNIARNASVGRKDVDLTGEASKLTMPGVDNGYGTPCPPCSPTSAIWLTVEYFDPMSAVDGGLCIRCRVRSTRLPGGDFDRISWFRRHLYRKPTASGPADLPSDK